MTKQEKIEWILSKHIETNHMYDKYLPYEFHLKLVVEVHKRFKNLLPMGLNEEVLELAAYGHDLIEDTRTSYNDVKKVLGENVADVIYAVTNDKGKNRDQRAGERYYNGIVGEPGAAYIKLCDRIANVQYGIITGSEMVGMYERENAAFLERLQIDKSNYLYPMSNYLKSLFEDNGY